MATAQLTRVEPGRYRTIVAGRTYDVFRDGSKGWFVERDGESVAPPCRTKKEAVSRLEIHLRLSQDRKTTNALKIAGRTEITRGTKLTLVHKSVRGIVGKVTFVRYTKTDAGKEWIEVLDREGRSRIIDPAKIKTVHRKKAGYATDDHRRRQ